MGNLASGSGFPFVSNNLAISFISGDISTLKYSFK